MTVTHSDNNELSGPIPTSEHTCHCDPPCTPPCIGNRREPFEDWQEVDPEVYRSIDAAFEANHWIDHHRPGDGQ